MPKNDIAAQSSGSCRLSPASSSVYSVVRSRADGAGIGVGGTGVDVGVGGADVDVGVGGTGVGVAVGGMRVGEGVGGTGVAAGGTGVGVGSFLPQAGNDRARVKRSRNAVKRRNLGCMVSSLLSQVVKAVE
jgi:hypothetical protein